MHLIIKQCARARVDVCMYAYVRKIICVCVCVFIGSEGSSPLSSYSYRYLSCMLQHRYNASCLFLKRENGNTWEKWVLNTYEVPEYDTFEMSFGVWIAIFIVTTLSLLTTFVVMLLIIKYRQNPLISSVSKTFSVLTVLGLGLSIASSYLLLSSQPSEGECAARLWLAPMGTTVALAALGAKTYRIHMIFGELGIGVPECRRANAKGRPLTDCYILTRFMLAPVLCSANTQVPI